MAKVTFKNNRKVTPKGQAIKCRKSAVDATDKIMRLHLFLHDEASRGWSARTKPNFKYKTVNASKTTQRLRFEVFYTAPLVNSARTPIYRLLSEGTSQRHAAMAFPYNRKTRPNKRGQFGSGGKRAFVSKQYQGISPDTGLPGITARNWITSINKELEPDFRLFLGKGYGNGFRR